ncbi:MAG: hypothetical protein RLP12_12565, partial [Ekhidna sp.]
MKVTLIQTLEDRDNPDIIESNGPFECRHHGAWLGPGYYFWDTHLELGHWWGEFGYKNNYVICSAIADLNEENCFDLHGNGDHRKELTEISELIKQKGLKKDPLVSEVIEYLKKLRIWSYSAIRALGTLSIVHNMETRGEYWDLLYFTTGGKQFLDLY